MEGFISDEFSVILNQIPENDYELEHIFQVFKQYFPMMARRNKIVSVRAIIFSPGNRVNPKGIKQEVNLYEGRKTGGVSDEIFRYDTGIGGYVEIIFGIDKCEGQDAALMGELGAVSKAFYLLYERAMAMNSLYRLTFTDGLTGIANDTQLFRYMNTIYSAGRLPEYCTDFINIKNMKLANEMFGQEMGDILLNKFANTIKNYIGDDGCIARFGGDNFGVIILEKRHRKFLNFMKKLDICLDMPDGQRVTYKVEARIGYYKIKEGDGPHDALGNSSIAARYAKRDDNPDFVRYEEHMKTQMLKMKQLEQDIGEAINNNELIIFVQPKADISGDGYRICGAEALVRWKKDGRIIPPVEFIPIAEKNGLITQVDFYVFELVCRMLKKWKDEGRTPVRVSSNFSRRHLRDDSFADNIKEIVDRYEVDTSYLEIEITESYDMDDMEALESFEKNLHKLGIQLSIDDFGSGFSSLKMIKNMVSDTIKLDKSIIDGVGDGNEGDDIMVSHIIQMIKRLGKDVIAEGVEYKHQVDFLKANGCGMIQGYLFGKPMTPDEFEKEYLEG